MRNCNPSLAAAVPALSAATVDVKSIKSRNIKKVEIVYKSPHTNPNGLQTTKDGKFSVEFVECLAGCGSAPVMMCNEDFHEGVTHTEADEIMGGCK